MNWRTRTDGVNRPGGVCAYMAHRGNRHLALARAPLQLSNPTRYDGAS